jgi:hypothetical protein
VVQSTDKNFLVPVSRRQPRARPPVSGHPASSRRSLTRFVRFVCFSRLSACLVLMPSAVPVCPVHRRCLPSCCSFEAACPLVTRSLVIIFQVGGAVIAAGSRACSLVEAVNRLYPGRASLSPVLDVFITLLSLGAKGGHLPDLRLLHHQRCVSTKLVASTVQCGCLGCIFRCGLGTHCAEFEPCRERLPFGFKAARGPLDVCRTLLRSSSTGRALTLPRGSARACSSTMDVDLVPCTKLCHFHCRFRLGMEIPSVWERCTERICPDQSHRHKNGEYKSFTEFSSLPCWPGWKKVLADREVTYEYLKQRLTEVAEAQGKHAWQVHLASWPCLTATAVEWQGTPRTTL